MIIALSLVHEALVFMWDVCSVANVWNCSVTARKSEGKVPRNVDYIFFKRCIAWVLIEVDDFSACCVEVVQVPDVFWGTLSHFHNVLLPNSPSCPLTIHDNIN